MTLKEYFRGDRFAAAAGVELLVVSAGYARACMEVGPGLLNASGWCQGGAIFTLADLAFAAAVNTHDRVTVSVNCNMVFLKSVRQGKLYAEARELFDHARLPYATVNVTDEDGELVAVFNSSGYRTSREVIPYDSFE